MNGRRFTTVHDFTALRVHPDGTRVPTNGIGKRKRKDKRIVQDRRGNWVARDAAGIPGVKRRRTAMEDVQEEEGEGFDLTGVNELVNDAESSSNGRRRAGVLEENGKGGIPAGGPLKVKRHRFLDDLSFLNTPTTASVDRSAPSSVIDERMAAPDGSSERLTAANALPNPSSDLLKCIHYLASRYYHEMGQLEDVTRESRKERRRRRRIKLGLEVGERGSQGPKQNRRSKGNTVDEDESSSSDEGGSSGEAEEDMDEEEGQDDEHGRDNYVDFGDDEDEGDAPPNEERPSTRADDSDEDSVDEWKEKYADQDMYKIFDGSALMAMGMLMQEYVAELVNVRRSPSPETNAGLNTRRRRRRTKQEIEQDVDASSGDDVERRRSRTKPSSPSDTSSDRSHHSSDEENASVGS